MPGKLKKYKGYGYEVVWLREGCEVAVYRLADTNPYVTLVHTTATRSEQHIAEHEAMDWVDAQTKGA